MAVLVAVGFCRELRLTARSLTVYASTRRSSDEQQHLLLTCQLRFGQAGLAPARLKQEVSQTRRLIPFFQTYPSAIETYSAFTQIAACTLAKSLIRPFTSKAPAVCYLHRCFDCYRVERSSSRTGFAPVVDQRLFTAHHSMMTSDGEDHGFAWQPAALECWRRLC